MVIAKISDRGVGRRGDGRHGDGRHGIGIETWPSTKGWPSAEARGGRLQARVVSRGTALFELPARRADFDEMSSKFRPAEESSAPPTRTTPTLGHCSMPGRTADFPLYGFPDLQGGVMRCACEASESAHHHVNSAIYPCDGFTSCRRCEQTDERLWHDYSHRRAGYDRGGALEPGRTTAVNTSGRPERVQRVR
jgi:hypothetical protein